MSNGIEDDEVLGRLKKMAEAEDECESIGVGGLMVDLGWKNDDTEGAEVVK